MILLVLYLKELPNSRWEQAKVNQGTLRKGSSTRLVKRAIKGAMGMPYGGKKG